MGRRNTALTLICPPNDIFQTRLKALRRLASAIKHKNKSHQIFSVLKHIEEENEHINETFWKSDELVDQLRRIKAHFIKIAECDRANELEYAKYLELLDRVKELGSQVGILRFPVDIMNEMS